MTDRANAGGAPVRRLARRSFLGGMVAASAAVVAPLPLAAAPLAKVRQLGVLRVAVYQDNRPWSWNDNGTLRGIDVDLARALADGLGVKAQVVEFMAGDDIATDLRNAVWRGGLLGFQPADLMMHVPFDRELMAQNDQVALCAPYYRESFAAACGPEQNDCEVPVPQYRGRRLSAAVASVPDVYLLSGFGGTLRSSVTHFNTGYDAVAALGTRQSDVAVATRAEVEAALHDMANPQIKARQHTLDAMMSPGWDVAMAVKDNSRTLGDAIEPMLSAMAANGRMQAIFAAHGVTWRPALAAG
ncbi:MAG TPA: transporter substrate-binding domain-containing protein [Novosphingobium sp.]|nr:transporter substrate-binding domain-containing protein [Novosphingobium sp.]